MKTNSSIYEAKNYRVYMKSELESTRFGRGARTKLAAHLGVQSSFISIVLSGRQEFSPEHGIRIAEFLGLDATETEYFVFLIERERAGSEALRLHYQRQIERILKSRALVDNRVRANTLDLSPADLSEYYGKWFNIAVHMALRNAGNQDLDAIANSLRLRRADVKRSVALLERLGFIRSEKGKIVVLDQRFHVGAKNPALRAHHTNWRLAAIRSLDEPSENDLRYTLVMSIDEKALNQIRAILLAAIENVDPFVRDAADRRVCALNIDLFDLDAKA